MTLIVILAVLFLALFVVIPLVEKYGKRHTDEEIGKMSRWVFPLVGLILLVQLVKMMFFE